ncbi:MAG: hypothetical protein HYV13_03380 [Candidatus Doudnabacteria bacterium]|nr:hypothetical protein [Candidatus Doudnabacteria bacterium]
MAELDHNLIQKLFRMGERFQADLERPVPVLTNLSQLSEQATVVQFENLVKEIITRDDGETALLGVTILTHLLKEHPQLKIDYPQVYARYEKLIGLLKFINLSAQAGLPEIKQIIADRLLDAIEAGIKVTAKLDFVLDVYDDFLLEGTIAYELGKAMLVCGSRLGQQPLVLSKTKRQVPPTLGNWLIDYRSAVAADKGGSYEQITYMNQSENARKLLPADKNLLKKVLKLYDWLRFGTPIEEVVEAVPAPKVVALVKAPSSDQTPPLGTRGGREGLGAKFSNLTPPPQPPAASEVGKFSYSKRGLPNATPPKPPVVPSGTFQKPLTIEELKKEVIAQRTPPPSSGLRPSSPVKGEDILSEIKREVATKELDILTPSVRTSPLGTRGDQGGLEAKPSNLTPPPPSYSKRGELRPNALPQIKFIDDLKRIDVNYLRRGDPKSQTSNLKSAIYNLAATNRMYVHQIVVVFQQSPLFKAYLAHGSSKVAGQQVKGDLTQAEFEAVADLKRELERM